MAAPVMRAHPAEGALRALLDRELGPWQRLRVRAHLWRCRGCRERLEAVRTVGECANVLLKQLTVPVDTAEGWARLVVRSGGRASRGRRVGRAAALAGTALVVLALFMVLRSHRPTSIPGITASSHALLSDARAGIRRDRCCADFDGGMYADDGLLTLSEPGERVSAVVVYEDTDHSGTFTPGDVVRYVSPPPHP